MVLSRLFDFVYHYPLSIKELTINCFVRNWSPIHICAFDDGRNIWGTLKKTHSIIITAESTLSTHGDTHINLLAENPEPV
jgi:hypothetical protein